MTSSKITSQNTLVSSAMSFKRQRQKIEFLLSANDLKQLPEDQGFEVAFCGRSNAGKSSALNTLVGQRQLARVSKTPGRTQLINTFTVDEQRRLIDLPGYGYAKVPTKIRNHWDVLLTNYFYQRKSLCGLVLLMDSRHPLTDLDQAFLEMAEAANLSTRILLTKSDKLSFGAAKNQLLKVKNKIGANNKISAQLFSSLKRQGVDEAYEYLDRCFQFHTSVDNVISLTMPNSTDN